MKRTEEVEHGNPQFHDNRPKLESSTFLFYVIVPFFKRNFTVFFLPFNEGPMLKLVNGTCCCLMVILVEWLY